MRKLLTLAAPLVIALALGMAACGDGDGGEATPTVAEGPILDGKEVERCLAKKGAEVAPPGKDAILRGYSDEAVAEGGYTFIVPAPIIHFIFFADQVDLERAEDEFRDATARAGARATGLQADAYGNALAVYFAPQGGVDKTPVNECLGGEPQAVPGFETPYQPTDLAPEIIN
jgi:hypothetical protein